MVVTLVVDSMDKYLFDIGVLLVTWQSLHDWHYTFRVNVILNIAGVCGLLVGLLLVLGMEWTRL
jgi:hypothetical protein